MLPFDMYAQGEIISSIPNDGWGCALEGVPKNNEEKPSRCGTSSLYNDEEYQRYLPENTCSTVKIKVNFIFPQLVHQSGASEEEIGNFDPSFPEHIAFLDDVIAKLNYKMANLVQGDCSGVFRSDSKIQYVVNKVFIQDEYAWDAFNDPNHADPNNGPCPDWDWYLNQFDKQIRNDPSIPKGINVYFTNESESYKELVLNHTMVTDPKWTGLACSEWFSGTDYDKPSRVHEPNWFLDYYWKREVIPFIAPYQGNGVTWIDPIHPNKSSRNWAVQGGARSLIHEIGHSYNLFHGDGNCDTEIMNNTAEAVRNYISPYELKKMHYALTTSSLRQYATCDSRFCDPTIVTENELWDANMRLYSDIIVKKGAKLSIVCKLLMPFDGKIIVEPGGELNVDGATITYNTVCEEEGRPWNGIYVVGTNGVAQTTAGTQGLATIQAKATIEGARVAVRNWNPQLGLKSAGGIIHATESTFKNNIKSVEFLRYQNLTNTHIKPYDAYFRNMDFNVEENKEHLYRFNRFDDQFTMWFVDGIELTDTRFKNTNPLNKEKGAIVAIDAGFNLVGNTYTAIDGFFKGVDNTKVNTNNTFSIKKMLFNNNIYGIYSRLTNSIKVEENEFKVGRTLIPMAGSDRATGLTLDGGTGYTVQNNDFQPTEYDAYQSFGVYADNTGTEANVIYKNKFSGLTAANHAHRINKGGELVGLQYLCNVNTTSPYNNQHDFYVTLSGRIAANHNFFLLIVSFDSINLKRE